MKIFTQKDPIARIEKDLAGLCSRRDTVDTRIADAEAQVAEHRQAAVKVALNGSDPATLDRLEHAQRQAEDRRATLAAARDQLAGEIAATEAKLTAARDQAQRQAAVAEIARLGERVVAALPNFLEAAAGLRTAVEEVVRLVPEAGGLANFLRAVEGDVPRAQEQIRSSLGFRANEISLGGGSPTLPPAPALPEPTMPPPVLEVTRPVTLLFDAVWTCHGRKERAAAGDLVQLPAATAARAAAAGVVAVDRSDPRVAGVLGRIGTGLAADRGIADLDADAVVVPAVTVPRLRPRRQF